MKTRQEGARRPFRFKGPGGWGKTTAVLFHDTLRSVGTGRFASAEALDRMVDMAAGS